MPPYLRAVRVAKLHQTALGWESPSAGAAISLVDCLRTLPPGLTAQSIAALQRLRVARLGQAEGWSRLLVVACDALALGSGVQTLTHYRCSLADPIGSPRCACRAAGDSLLSRAFAALCCSTPRPAPFRIASVALAGSARRRADRTIE